MNTSYMDTEKGSEKSVSLGGIIANVFVAFLTLVCLAVVALSGYYLTKTASSYVSARGYSTWVETPALLEGAANPTEDHPYDAIYSVNDKTYRAPNYGRSLVSFDYEKKHSTRRVGRRSGRGSYERNDYHEGSNVHILVDRENPTSYQFDLYSDTILQLCIYTALFFISALLAKRFARILLCDDEEEEEAVS